MDSERAIVELLNRVRARWRALRLLRAMVRAPLIRSAALVTGSGMAQRIGRSPLVLAALFAAMVLVALGALVWSLVPLGRPPTDKRVARFIEERVPGLDDRLATAVDLLDSQRAGRAA